MADTPDLGSGAARCAGSTPAPSTLFIDIVVQQLRRYRYSRWINAYGSNAGKAPLQQREA
jgi:hypothetical protein